MILVEIGGSYVSPGDVVGAFPWMAEVGPGMTIVLRGGGTIPVAGGRSVEGVLTELGIPFQIAGQLVSADSTAWDERHLGE